MRERVIALMAIVAGVSACASAPNKTADDKEITRFIQDVFVQHGELGLPDQINVTTSNHVVYLTGTTSTGLQRDVAASLAMQTPGVNRIVNTVTVIH
jgi:osmotically-inducible protein OsmY